ncbi:MAG: hypothetical protein HS104_23335 [Polyangiaceae bacterium]|nr:hypothetical protein [Polyangiaceae bacterium]
MSAVAGVGAQPSAPAAVGGADPEIMIASLEQQIGDMQLTSGRSRAEQLSTNRKASLEKAKQSLRDAREKEDEGGFWSKLASKAKTVATVATVVAAAAAIGTGAGAPAGLALVAVACSAGSFAMKETGADTKLATLSIGGSEFDLNLSDCVALAGVACGSVGAAGAAGSTSTVATGTAAEACQVAGVAAQATNVGATGAQAVFVVRAGDAQADAVEHHADSREATNRADKAQSQIEDQIDLLRGAMETRRKVREAVGKIMEQRHDTMVRLMEVRA